MSRTKRRIDQRTRDAILKPDINPITHQPYKSSPQRQRIIAAQLRGDDGVGYGESRTDASVDRHGNWKISGWCQCWGRTKLYNHPQRMQRQANKIKVRLGIQDWLDQYEPDIDHEQEMLDWYYESFAWCDWGDDDWYERLDLGDYNVIEIYDEYEEYTYYV